MKSALSHFRAGRAWRVLALCWLVCPGLSSATEIRVMTFNIEWGGALVSFGQTVEAIRRAEADIVGIQEAEGNIERLARELGWNADARNYVISRFPLLDPPGADGRYVLVEIEPGRVVAMTSLHLPSDPYGPYAVNEGAEPGAVLELEREVRLPSLMPYLEKLPAVAESGLPVFVTGDFNAPSHLDWADSTVGLRNQIRYPLNWPVSSAMERAGFTDAWRAVYPDPVSDPGLTWWAGRPYLERWTPAVDEPQDRIDFVWFRGAATPTSAQLAGEQGGPGVEIGLNPWPSDHRAVVVEFEVQPAPMPELLTTSRRVNPLGEPVDVRFEGKAGSLIQARGPATENVPGPVLDSRKADGPMSFRLPAEPLVAGHYHVVAVREGQAMVRAFWVVDPALPAEVSLPAATIEAGQGIEIHWRNAPGNRNDYIAVFPEGAVHREDEAGVAWAYIGAEPSGSLTLDAATAGDGWPLSPGRYVARLLEDDGYRLLAESTVFEIKAEP